MSKWIKTDPADIKVGDRVRVKTINKPEAYDFTVIERGVTWIGVFATVNHRAWYVRKPKKAKPPTRPDEPPVGSFFRVDRTGREFYRYPQVSLTHYFHLACDAGDRPWVAWNDITEPGDTITMLELREVEK